MNPQEAVQALIKAGWSETRIAREIGTSQPTIHRIKHGSQQRGAGFETCSAVIALANRVVGVACQQGAEPIARAS